jgi:hypothetical protein
MDANNGIRLRLRFYKDVNENVDIVRQKTENLIYFQHLHQLKSPFGSFHIIKSQ